MLSKHFRVERKYLLSQITAHLSTGVHGLGTLSPLWLHRKGRKQHSQDATGGDWLRKQVTTPPVHQQTSHMGEDG